MRLAPALLLLLLAPAARAEGDAHWSYEGAMGPSAWAALDPAWGACAAGEAQSPIDLAGAVPGEVEALALDWEHGADWEVVHTGHTIQAQPVGGSAGTLTLGGVAYDLVQVHFHAPSEHAVGGARTAMEAHFVHRAPDGALAVVGVLLRGGGEPGMLDALLAAAPAAGGTAPAGVLDPAALMPAEGAFVRYRGSLTTPPCSEGVTWTVMSRAVRVSDAAVAAFAARVPRDARPLQPRNGREVLTN